MSNLFFGEIAEPSTRALIDDETEYLEYEKEKLDVEGDFKTPKNLKTLIFTDTSNVKNILISCLQKPKSTCKIPNAGIEIYHIPKHDYIVCWSQLESKLLSGEIVEIFEDWLKAAKKIYAVTSNSIGSYQSNTLEDKPASILRYLSNDDTSFSCKKLEPPNLVTGLAANIFSYCIHTNMKCTFFIAYIDALPLDSINSGPLVELFKQMNLPVGNYNLDLKTSVVTSNLYM